VADRIYLTWDRLKQDLAKLKTPQEFQAVQQETYPDQSSKAVVHYASQTRRLAHEMQKGDWVVVPSKKKAAISFAEITGPYVFDREAPNPYYHYRTVKWIAKDVPRSQFDQDLLYSFGAFKTICQIQRNDAENRVRAMAAHDWKAAAGKVTLPRPHDEETNGDRVDLELLARDQTAKLIIERFKGHGLERLVEAAGPQVDGGWRSTQFCTGPSRSNPYKSSSLSRIAMLSIAAVDAADYFLIDFAFIAQTGALVVEGTPGQAEGAVVLKADGDQQQQQTTSVLAQLFSAKPVL
jgi:hypothetical protein